MNRSCAALLMAMTLSLSAAPALSLDFTEAQKQEFGAIIREYLLKHPEVVRDAIQELERKEQEAEKTAQGQALKDHARDIFRAPGDVVVGNPQGGVTLVEFFDYNCPYCKKSYPDVAKLIEKDSDLRVVLKEFPILGPSSLYAARAALASEKQGKYWKFHEAMLGHDGRLDEAAVLEAATGVGLDLARLKQDMAAPAIDEIIGRNMKMAEALNIEGTPAFIVDSTIIPGAVGYDGLAAAVSQVREAGGCKIC